MGNKGDVWDIIIQGGHVHCNHVSILDMQEIDGPILNNLIPLPHLFPNGSLSAKND